MIVGRCWSGGQGMIVWVQNHNLLETSDEPVLGDHQPGWAGFFSSPCLGWAWSVVVAASTVVLPRPEGSYFPTINPNWTCNGGVERRGTGGGFSPMCCDPFPVNLLCIALLLLPTTDCSVRSFSARILPFRGARIEHVDCHLPVPVWFIFTSWPAESECWWWWRRDGADCTQTSRSTQVNPCCLLLPVPRSWIYDERFCDFSSFVLQSCFSVVCFVTPPNIFALMGCWWWSTIQCEP